MVLKISRTEERGTKPPIRKQPLRNCLSDSALPRSSEPIQPVDRGPENVVCPEFDLVENGYAGPLKTTVAVAMPILGLLRWVKAV